MSYPRKCSTTERSRLDHSLFSKNPRAAAVVARETQFASGPPEAGSEAGPVGSRLCLFGKGIFRERFCPSRYRAEAPGGVPTAGKSFSSTFSENDRVEQSPRNQHPGSRLCECPPCPFSISAVRSASSRNRIGHRRNGWSPRPGHGRQLVLRPERLVRRQPVRIGVL